MSHPSHIGRQDSLTWPTFCIRVEDENGDNVYQGTVLANYTPSTLKAHADSALTDPNGWKQE